MVNQVNDGYMQIELYLAGSMAKKSKKPLNSPLIIFTRNRIPNVLNMFKYPFENIFNFFLIVFFCLIH